MPGRLHWGTRHIEGVSFSAWMPRPRHYVLSAESLAPFLGVSSALRPRHCVLGTASSAAALHSCCPPRLCPWHCVFGWVPGCVLSAESSVKFLTELLAASFAASSAAAVLGRCTPWLLHSSTATLLGCYTPRLLHLGCCTPRLPHSSAAALLGCCTPRPRL